MQKPPLPPSNLLPQDGRFGAGPSRIRPEQVRALYEATELGTSHRQPPVKSRVHSIREGLRELFSLPEGYEITLGSGGATAFWAIAATSLVEKRARTAVFGEFGGKFATDLSNTPWLSLDVVEAAPGSLATVQEREATADVYAYPQNETSTGVTSPLYKGAPSGALTLVDATSIAGAITVDWEKVDAYYFSPQKCFGAEGGLWVAVLSPEAQERAAELAASPSRFMPTILDLSAAIKQSKADQTVNTPAISSLILFDEQIKWMLREGGLQEMQARSAKGAGLIHAWAKDRPFASLFVKERQLRSPVVTTVDFDTSVSAAAMAKALREVGVVDIEGYRKLGRNQLRIASFPSIQHTDIEALLASIDWMVEHSQ